MTWSWSGAYDIASTLVSSGSGATNFSVDTLAIPSGHVTSPGTGAILVLACMFQLSPNAGLRWIGPNDPSNGNGCLAYTFVDANGVEQMLIQSSQANGNNNPYTGSFLPSPVVVIPRTKYALPDTFLGSPGLNGGGTIRIKGAFANGSNEVLTGSMVAAIWDSTEPTERMRFDASANNQPGIFSGSAFYPPTGDPSPAAFGYFENAAVCANAGIASFGNFAPTYIATGWSTLITHTSGSFWAGIGAYSGPGDPSPSTLVPFAFLFPFGAPNALIELPIVRDVPGTTSSRARSYAQVIG